MTRVMPFRYSGWQSLRKKMSDNRLQNQVSLTLISLSWVVVNDDIVLGQGIHTGNVVSVDVDHHQVVAVF